MSNVKKADRTKPLEHFYCIICGEEISKERIVRKAVTCSEAHGILLRNERRRLRDLVRCRLCNRPSTPEGAWIIHATSSSSGSSSPTSPRACRTWSGFGGLTASCVQRAMRSPQRGGLDED